MEKYCYSFIGENYDSGLFETRKEAIESAKKDRPEEENVWVGIVVKPTLRWNSCEEEIIESMQEDLYDQCGEYAEGQLDDITNEQELALAKMIDEAVEKWINKYNIKTSCYTVENCKLHNLDESEVE